MREDEEFVKRALGAYFGNHDLFIKGEDPPDYYAVFSEGKIPLEVTRAAPIYLRQGKIQNRNTNDISFIRLVKELNCVFNGKIQNNTIRIHAEGPIDDFSKFKKCLKEELEQYIECLNQDKLNCLHIRIEGASVLIRSGGLSGYEGKIIGSIGIKPENSIDSIDWQVEMILEDILRRKEDKIKDICGEKWLAILNGYILASHAEYTEAMRTVNVPHTFTRVFLVEQSESVTELWNSSRVSIST